MHEINNIRYLPCVSHIYMLFAKDGALISVSSVIYQRALGIIPQHSSKITGICECHNTYR